MRKTIITSIVVAVLCIMGMGSAYGPPVSAEETIKYSCSAQVFEAFETERLEAFTKATGIEVDLYVASSSSSVNRLMHGFSDIASNTRELYYRHKESGYVQIPFCKDPLAVITHSTNPVADLSTEQLRGVFGGAIANWKQLGGPDEPIIVVVPGKNTGAFKNFLQEAMKSDEIKYDLMTYKSTMVIETVQRFPWSISFIAQGAVSFSKDIKKIKVDGILPSHSDYPFYQVYSFVTKGEPSGGVKGFIDFAFSEEGKAIAKKRGMCPMPCESR